MFTNYFLGEVKLNFASGRLEGTRVSGGKAPLHLIVGLYRGVWSY